MKTILFFLTVFLCISGLEGQNSAPAKFAEKRLNFVGKIEKIGEVVPRDSGGVIVYQLLKLKVEQICAGEVDKEDIVVDFIKLKPDDLDDFGMGDRIYMETIVSEDIDTRYNSKGIREPSEEVHFFYIGTKINKIPSRQTCN